MPVHRNYIREDYSAGMNLRARPAQIRDLMLTYRWANDQFARKMSFTPEHISFEEHSAWFERVVSDETELFLIIEGKVGGLYSPIAQFRVDAKGTVSMSLAKQYRGRRLATPVIRTGLDYVKAHSDFEALVAYIKPENVRSMRAFMKAGFRPSGTTSIKGQRCLEFIYEIDRSLKGDRGCAGRSLGKDERP